KTSAEQRKVTENQDPKKIFAPRFLALAEKNPNDPIAVDALIWVVTGSFGKTGFDETIAKAKDILVREHIDSDKLGPLCQSLALDRDQNSQKQLKTIFAKNPDKSVKGEACLALGQNQYSQANLLKQMTEHPESVKQLEAALGKETIEGLRKADLAKLEAA